MWSLLRTNADLRALFVAQVVSFAGDWFAYVAFVGLVQDITDAPILVSAVYIAQTLPAFFMTVVAGPVADRFDRRRILQVAALVQAMAAASLLLVRSVATLPIGFLGLAVISAVGSFVGPATQAGIPNLVRHDDELAKASLMFGAVWGVMLAVGAALGGVVASVFGRDVAFGANAISFVVAAVLVTSVRRPMQELRAGRTVVDGSEAVERASPMRPVADMVEAARYARRDPVILTLMASKASFAVGSGIFGLLAVLASEELAGRGAGSGDRTTGWLIAARGAGVALGPLVAARLVGPALSRVVLWCGISGVAFGVCYLGLSVAPALAVAVPFVLLAHIGGGAQWTMSTYGLQRRAPDAIRGRLLAGDFGMVTLIITLSNVAAGLLAGAAGPRLAIGVFGAIAIGAGFTYVVVTRPVRAALAAEEART